MVLNDRVNEGCRMSVLIKDIKMPESCLDCPIYDNYNYHCNLYAYGIPARYNCDPSKRPEWCELEELPEHHGDLVDVNEIRWDDHYDSDGNLSKYKVAYSDEMPDPVIKGEKLNNERIN